MRQLLPVLGLLAINTTVAQPILQSAEMLPVGGSMTLRPYTNFSVVDTTIQGANATWDFSGLTIAPGMTNLNVTIMAPGQTPYAANFPTANYAYMESPVTAYRYFNLSSSNMERVGSFSNATLKTYSDPQIEYVFPLEIGSTSTDTWNNDASWDGGTYSFACIGTGTLMLPGHEWNDVLMVRAIVVETDLSEFSSYFWYSSATGATLVQYIAGDGFFVGEQGYFEIGSEVGMEEFAGTEFLTWNNPVNDELHLGTRSARPDDLPWRMFGATGQLIGTGVFRSSGGPIDNWSIATADLTAGIYVLALGEGPATTSLRFVKH